MNQCRWGNETTENINKSIFSSIPTNTKRSHKSIWAQFTSFCDTRNYSLDERTTKERLATILQDYAFNMKKTTGEDYKESVIKTMWNVTAKLLQDKYHNEFKIDLNPFVDITFKAARDARDSKRRQLQGIPEKRKVSAVSFNASEKTAILNSQDENTPDGLQKKFFHVASAELAWRGGEAVTALTEYFKEETNNFGEKTGRIEYNPVFSKTKQGGSHPCADSKFLSPNVNNLDACPTRLFHKLMSKRFQIKCNRLFLTPNPNWQLKHSKGWYKECPVGKNIILKWTREAAEQIGMDIKRKKITNQSYRSTAVTDLAKAGVPEQELMKITGHGNSNSLQPYLQMDISRHQEILNKMRSVSNSVSDTSSACYSGQSFNTKTTQNIVNISTEVSQARSSPTPTPTIVFKDCTFNVTNFNCNDFK